MALTTGDKAEYKEIAREIIKEVLQEHIRFCPHHAAFELSKARVLGIIIGVVLASGVTSSTVAAIVIKLFS